jgi:hypothetical protein
MVIFQVRSLRETVERLEGVVNSLAAMQLQQTGQCNNGGGDSQGNGDSNQQPREQDPFVLLSEVPACSAHFLDSCFICFLFFFLDHFVFYLNLLCVVTLLSSFCR